MKRHGTNSMKYGYPKEAPTEGPVGPAGDSGAWEERAKEPVIECVHCNQPVETITMYGRGGTTWIHTDGKFECEPSYASPNLIKYERERDAAKDRV